MTVNSTMTDRASKALDVKQDVVQTGLNAIVDKKTYMSAGKDLFERVTPSLDKSQSSKAGKIALTVIEYVAKAAIAVIATVFAFTGVTQAAVGLSQRKTNNDFNDIRVEAEKLAQIIHTTNSLGITLPEAQAGKANEQSVAFGNYDARKRSDNIVVASKATGAFPSVLKSLTAKIKAQADKQNTATKKLQELNTLFAGVMAYMVMTKVTPEISENGKSINLDYSATGKNALGHNDEYNDVIGAITAARNEVSSGYFAGELAEMATTVVVTGTEKNEKGTPLNRFDVLASASNNVASIYTLTLMNKAEMVAGPNATHKQIAAEADKLLAAYRNDPKMIQHSMNEEIKAVTRITSLRDVDTLRNEFNLVRKNAIRELSDDPEKSQAVLEYAIALAGPAKSKDGKVMAKHGALNLVVINQRINEVKKANAPKLKAALSFFNNIEADFVTFVEEKEQLALAEEKYVEALHSQRGEATVSFERTEKTTPIATKDISDAPLGDDQIKDLLNIVIGNDVPPTFSELGLRITNLDEAKPGSAMLTHALLTGLKNPGELLVNLGVIKEPSEAKNFIDSLVTSTYQYGIRSHGEFYDNGITHVFATKQDDEGNVVVSDQLEALRAKLGTIAPIKTVETAETDETVQASGVKEKAFNMLSSIDPRGSRFDPREYSFFKSSVSTNETEGVEVTAVAPEGETEGAEDASETSSNAPSVNSPAGDESTQTTVAPQATTKVVIEEDEETNRHIALGL